MEEYGYLEGILRKLKRIAVAFSGGVDSAFLLAKARDVLGAKNVLAVTAVSAVFPERERREASAFCESIGVRQKEVSPGLLSLEAFGTNPVDRCYYCKRELMAAMKKAAEDEGFPVLAEGTNADDTMGHRPGLKALRELGIRSPLMEAGLKKAEIRELSRELGLPTWSKPSAACLASRIAHGESVTPEKLRTVEEAEELLLSLGISGMRVRLHGSIARIETSEADAERVLENRALIVQKLRSLGAKFVTLDLEPFRSGRLEERQ